MIVSIPDLCTLTSFVLHVRLGCVSMSITAPISLLTNDFDVQSLLPGQMSLAAGYQICVIHEAMNVCKDRKIH